VSLYEGFLATGDDVGFQRGLAPILAFSFFAFIFYGLIRLIISRFNKNRKENKKEDKNKKTIAKK
jgi:uncharacterized protein (DUF2062 family)